MCFRLGPISTVSSADIEAALQRFEEILLNPFLRKVFICSPRIPHHSPQTTGIARIATSVQSKNASYTSRSFATETCPVFVGH
jgi:hypothetical protein